MPNCPDYVATWLGLTRASSVVALINTNLTAEALLHSIRVARPAGLIVADTLAPALTAVNDQLPVNMRVWVHGRRTPLGRQSSQNARRSTRARSPSASARPRRPPDPALFVYTSGTTGLPKAARVTHARIVEWSFWFAGMMDVRPEDRLYDCLPLYHSTGGVVAIGAMLVRGGSVVIRARFSASRFWDDVVDGDCTIFQYIGELCRYLVDSAAAPARARSTGCGWPAATACSGDVWRAFQERFAMPRILEFYAATEGNVSLYNCEGKPGAIGRVPPFLAHRFPVALVRCDPDAATPLRDADGPLHPLRPGRGRRGDRPRRSARPTPAGSSTAIPIRRPRRARCCATCSRRATAGSAPAT